jgi:predicted permease
METLAQDLRYAIRRLRNTPSLTVTMILLLALGIGATSAIFTLTYAVMFRSLAVARPSELYKLGKQSHCCLFTSYGQAREFSMVSYELYQHFRDRTRGFAELAAFEASESLFAMRRMKTKETVQSYSGEFVSGNYFLMFGIQPYVGRMLMASDDQLGAPPTVVMSYRLWQEKYHSDPSIIGTEFAVDGKPFHLIGITPPAFFGDRLRNAPPDLYLPLSSEPLLEANASLNKVDNSWLDVIGRIEHGTNPASLEAQMRVELKQWLRSHWTDMSSNDRTLFAQQTLHLTPGGSGITSMRQEYEHWLHILIVISGIALMIVCANVANLMLVRGLEQRSQIALSVALGAQLGRMARQVLTESMVLAMTGGVAGVAVSYAATGLILHFAFPAQNGMTSIAISAAPSLPVLAFTFSVAALTGIAFGLVPSWLAARADPIDALRGVGRSVGTTRGSAGTRLLPKALVIGQAALSLSLLSASGLLTLALHRLENQDLGFSEQHRIVIDTNPRLAGYRSSQLSPLYNRIHNALFELPGVEGVALCSYAPLKASAFGADIYLQGHPPPGPNDDSFAILNRVTPGFFAVMGTPVLRGRELSEQDTANSQPVAVVNEAFAKRFYPGENPLGKYFGRWLGGAGQYQIVGVVKDAYYWISDLGRRPSPNIFLPESQHDFRAKASEELSPGTHFLDNIIVKAPPGSALTNDKIRVALSSIDPNLPVISAQSLKGRINGQFATQRLIARLTLAFGILSLILASVGLYGVTTYNVVRRVNEIGVRLALGANPNDIVVLVLRGALALVMFGLMLGYPLSVFVGRFLGSQLYGTDSNNPVIVAVSIAVLALSASAAALLPALRARSVSPMEALRSE